MIEMTRKVPLTLAEALAKDSVGIEEMRVISLNLEHVPEKDAKRLGLMKEWLKVRGEDEAVVPTPEVQKKGK